MSRVVLDTSAVSALMQRREEALDRLRRYRADEVVLTSPVAAEIRYGLERLAPGSRRRQLLEREYARLREQAEWSDWSEAAAEEFGRQKAALERRGEPLDDMDIAIGAIARVLDAGVATFNERHFRRLDGLAVDGFRTGTD